MITPILPQVNGAERLSQPNDLNMAQPLQSFARGGIAVPFQRPFLRASDQEYLAARQAEYDKYVADANAYNEALTKYQTEVYNPYKASVEAYNTAADKYNTEVYNPYLQQVDAYNRAAAAYNTDVYQPYVSAYERYAKAVEDWNAGDRTTDYAGPAAPELRTFDMTAPTQPTAFGMSAPTLASEFKETRPTMPFKEEDITEFQKAAAERAQFDAAQRGLAIEAVNDPAKYNLSGFSVSPRMFAQGGPVKKNSAKDMLSRLKPQKFAIGGGAGDFRRIMDGDVEVDPDEGSAAYRSATGAGGIGLDAMNANIRNFFANNPDEATTRAAMEQYGVTDADIMRATGQGLSDRFPRRAAPAPEPVEQEPIWWTAPAEFPITVGNQRWTGTADGPGRWEPVATTPAVVNQAIDRGASNISNLAAETERTQPTTDNVQITPDQVVQPNLTLAREDLAVLPGSRPSLTDVRGTLNRVLRAETDEETGRPLTAADVLAQLKASQGRAVTTPSAAVSPSGNPLLYADEFVGPIPPGSYRTSEYSRLGDRFGRNLIVDFEPREDLLVTPGTAASLLNNFDQVDQRRTIMPVTDRATMDGVRMPQPGDPDFVGPVAPTTGGTTATTGGTTATTGGTTTTGGTAATTGGTTTTTTTPPADNRSAGLRAATGQGGIGLDKYYENIVKWFTDNPNATYDDINKAQDQWGVSDQDINDAFGRSKTASAAMLYALNSADFAQSTGGKGGLAGMNTNITSWLKANPKAGIADIYEAMLQYNLNTADFRRATGMTPTDYLASLTKPAITPVTPGGTTVKPVGPGGTTTTPGGTTTTPGGTATKVPGSIVPIPDLAMKSGIASMAFW